MKYRYTLAVLLSGAFWGVIGLFVRSLQELGFQQMQIVLVRVLTSALIMLVGLLLFKPQYLKIRLRDLWCFLGTGVCSITLFSFCYFHTIAAASLSVASVLLYTAPIFVTVMSAFLFRERITSVRVLSLVLAMSGCVLVTGVLFDMPVLSPSGILIGLGAGFGYALYSIFGRYAFARGYHSMTVSFWTFAISAIAILPFASPGDLVASIAVGTFPWVDTILLAVVSTVLPYLLYTYGLTGMTGGRASILASTEPVVATLMGVIVFHETMTGWSIVGTVLVLLAVTLPDLLAGVSFTKKTTR